MTDDELPLDNPMLVRREFASEERLETRNALCRRLHRRRRRARTRSVDAVARGVAAARRSRSAAAGGAGASGSTRELGRGVVAVDLSPRMVELARERGVDASVGDVQALPFEDGEFDVVVAAWMLYHVLDLDAALAEIARVLRPGGALRRGDELDASTCSELRELVGSGPSIAA